MINWPQQGNDYGERVERLIQSPQARSEFWQEAMWHSQGFAHFIQTHLGRRYGLAVNTFLRFAGSLGGGAYALHPYYRESRRLQGLVTVREQDILPMPNGCVAALPLDDAGQVTAIAIGNYANDHHYPTHHQGQPLPPLNLKPKSLRWGGRWTGTPFTIPYGSLVPATVDGLLVCEKNISVSHMANGATRLQPLVMNIGQAAGMAAALCVEQAVQPRDLEVRSLQEALLQDAIAPAAVIPLFNLHPTHPAWSERQRYYLNHPDAYSVSGEDPLLGQQSPVAPPQRSRVSVTEELGQPFTGVFQHQGEQDYVLHLEAEPSMALTQLSLVTLNADMNQQLRACVDQQKLKMWGRLNRSGGWLLVEKIEMLAEVTQ
jgi:hypothetical protein